MEPNEACMFESKTNEEGFLFPDYWNTFDWFEFDFPNPSSYDQQIPFSLPFLPDHDHDHIFDFQDKTTPFQLQEEFSHLAWEDELEYATNYNVDNGCKIEPVRSRSPAQVEVEENVERKKMTHGMKQSKNLMAERRRRQRLNNRLSILRSIVPKISKMDRTAIVGDAIDYINELLGRIKELQQKIEVVNPHNKLDIMDIFKSTEKTDRMFLKESSFKMEVERSTETDVRVEVWCGGPSSSSSSSPASPSGVLLSTVGAMEAIGLEIQHCAISCFNGFAMRASCSQGSDKVKLMSSEEIKQTLIRNAGYFYGHGEF